MTYVLGVIHIDHNPIVGITEMTIIIIIFLGNINFKPRRTGGFSGCWRARKYVPWRISQNWKIFQVSHFIKKIPGWWFKKQFLFFHILGISSSQLLLTPSFFRGVGQPPTRYCRGSQIHKSSGCKFWGYQPPGSQESIRADELLVESPWWGYPKRA